ncbi:hypothetical protein [Aliikangiella coralliicola]|uniref:Uncharacterized protein n=1 Tax=Aliikangiella coralliicola TaxID=2592383 RepID=A0A545UJ20_9GAMM|nr:hypothetical protein [Aliikangiella coralliicola]TQV89461.1 hypothetical protein FLL46_00850 [Aliikangiella coralliicola]
MQKYYAKIIGAICLVASTLMLYQWYLGNPAGGVENAVRAFGGSEAASLWLSLLLGIVGAAFGIRALFWNRVCVGDHCPID